MLACQRRRRLVRRVRPVAGVQQDDVDSIGNPEVLLQALQRLGLRDRDTAAYNLSYFTDYASKEIYKARRYGRTFSLLTFSIDNLPLVRVRLGAADAKKAVRGIIRALSKIIRDSDVIAKASDQEFYLLLPETAEAEQFGHPVWRAGKKVFAQAHCYDGIWRAAFWVGVDQQGLMTQDPRFSIPPYMGHMGWIALDVTRRCDADELRALALDSYRHFALKRMLARLDA